jgi:hypothetical protein
VKSAWVVGLLLVLVVTFVGWRAFQFSNSPRLRSESRRVWKDHAVRDIAERTRDVGWVQEERQALRVNASNSWTDSDTWMSPGLILMTNGDWIAYTNVCSKQDRRIHDLFIGRGSDNKWYYSTYHFCINMIDLRIGTEGGVAPATLHEFAKQYYLREFDGRSDESLSKTWPPKRN